MGPVDSNKVNLVAIFSSQIAQVRLAWCNSFSGEGEALVLHELRRASRSLRSLLSFFKPLFKRDEFKLYKNILRYQNKLPEDLRGIDELVNSVKRREEAHGIVSTHLREAAKNKRDEAWSRLQGEVSLVYLCNQLEQFSIWLSTTPLQVGSADLDLVKFCHKRIEKWSKDLREMIGAYEPSMDMPNLHKIRIKIKRLRYVLLGLPNYFAVSTELLDLLREAQQVIGVLHDNYVNELLAHELRDDEPELEEEINSFIGWEEKRIQEQYSGLPMLWQQLERELLCSNDLVGAGIFGSREMLRKISTSYALPCLCKDITCGRPMNWRKSRLLKRKWRRNPTSVRIVSKL